jgi:hypothetical protein
MKVYTIFAHGLETRVGAVDDSEWWVKNYGLTHNCYECCTGDRCDDDCIATYKRYNKNCPHCKGACHIKVDDIEYCLIK